MKLLQIKWERIMLVVLIATMTICWVAYLKVSNVNTLAIATINTFMTLIIAITNDTIRDFRQDVKKLGNKKEKD